MSSMIENLDKLNRKERFFLVGMALGKRKFELVSSFQQTLSSKFGISVPDTAFAAMDYHLNWIFAAAAMTFHQPQRARVYSNVGDIVDGTQEDVDLLVAFEDAMGINHLIMLEAKGVGAFDNKQLKHKMERFDAIFGADGLRFGDKVRPYFGLVSPHKPRNLHVDACPDWLRVDGSIPWFEMPIPERLVLFGCDERGTANKDRKFWTVRREQVEKTASANKVSGSQF